MPRHSEPDPFHADTEIASHSLFTALLVTLSVLYCAFYGYLNLPSITDLFLMLAGTFMGDGTRERLELVFRRKGERGSAIAVVAKARARATSILSGGLSGGWHGDTYGQGLVGGLWNSGNTCYRNSVLQALASLDYLTPHLEALSTEEALNDEYLHTGQALLELFDSLNYLDTIPRAMYVPGVVRSIDTNGSGWLHNEQQDAQEFFQKLTGAVEKEVARYQRRIKSVPGLETVMNLDGVHSNSKEPTSLVLIEEDLERSKLERGLRNPFEGLVAQRVGCLQCGYVEAIRLQTFTSLSLPLNSPFEYSLDECLSEFTAIERIDEVECEKCTLYEQIHQLKKLLGIQIAAAKQASSVSSSSAPSLSQSQVLSSITNRLDGVYKALDEDDFSPATFRRLKIPRKITSTKTKQTMIARPPPILVLHINRSQFDIMSGITRKNSAAVSFPKILNIGHIVTGSDLEVHPGIPISTGQKGIVLYELKSVISHYGNHHNGHYICYRKIEKGIWFRISDDRVLPMSENEVHHITNAFMLFYERMHPQEEAISLEKAPKESEKETSVALAAEDSLTPGSKSQPNGNLEHLPLEELPVPVGNITEPLSILTTPAEDPGIELDYDDISQVSEGDGMNGYLEKPIDSTAVEFARPQSPSSAASTENVVYQTVAGINNEKKGAIPQSMDGAVGSVDQESIAILVK